jgi:hypothetical protein
MTRSLRNAGLVLSPILAIAWCGDAQAYRPFDGTDAAIAEPGQVEIELGHAQYLQIGPERMLVAPTIVFNYGHDWPLRPVAEIFYERDFGGVTTTSALVGAIWQVRDNIAFDVGLRGAQVNDQPLREVRFGVTFGFPLR